MDIDDLLRATTEAQGSDLHLTAGVQPMIRLWGHIEPLAAYDVLSPEDTVQLAYGMLNAFQKQRFDKTWELDLAYSVSGLGRFRVNLYRQRGAVAAAIRVIPTRIPTPEELYLPPVLQDLTRRHRGLVLVTGPTGNGKSTTLAALINIINTERACHIVTVEDPIEYLHTHHRSIIDQRELNFDTQSFPNALRAVLREDPDVVMIGEMRDLETIAAALTIAETGHLVFATLHTATAAQSIDRIIDVFPPHQQPQVRAQLASVLEAVVSQQLVPNARFFASGATAAGRGPAAARRPSRREGGGEDSALDPLPEPLKAGLGSEQPQGGEADLAIGRTGRLPAVELMLSTPAIRNLIRDSKTHQLESAIQTGAQHGMQTMDAALAELHRRGLITTEVALARAIHPEELRKLIRV